MKVQRIGGVMVMTWGATVAMLLPQPLTGQPAPSADTKAMERILDRLVLGEVSSARTQTRGVWLEGHGLLFSIPYTVAPYEGETDTARTSEWRKRYPGVAALYFQATQARRALTLAAAVDSTRAALTTFFARWAGALSNLQPQHTVTVVVDFRTGEFPLPLLPGTPAPVREQRRRLVASVSFADILSMRKRDAPVAVLQRSIRFAEEQGEEPKNSEVAILADILDTHLRTLLGEVLSGESTRAVRVPQLGVVLMLCGTRVPSWSGLEGMKAELDVLSSHLESYRQAMQGYRKAAEAYKEADKASRESQEGLAQIEQAQRLLEAQLPDTTREAAKARAGKTTEAEKSTRETQARTTQDREREASDRNLENEVISLLGRYCPALSSLSDQESVFVLLEVGTFGDPQRKRMQIGVRMRDVRRLAREEITTQEFRKLAMVSHQ